MFAWLQTIQATITNETTFLDGFLNLSLYSKNQIACKLLCDLLLYLPLSMAITLIFAYFHTTLFFLY